MLGYIVEEFIILPVVYPCGTVSVSSIGSFSSVGSSSKSSHPSVHLSIGSCHIQYYSKKKRGREKCIKPQQEKARHEEQINRSKVVV